MRTAGARQRSAPRRGAKRAAVAVGHSILVTVYHLLKNGLAYKDLGANYIDQRDKRVVARRALHRLEQLGYKVTVEEVAWRLVRFVARLFQGRN